MTWTVEVIEVGTVVEVATVVQSVGTDQEALDLEVAARMAGDDAAAAAATALDARLDVVEAFGSVPDADGVTKGKLRLGGDLGGTADDPLVPGLVAVTPLAGLGNTNNHAAIQASVTAGGTTTLKGTHTVRRPVVVPSNARLTATKGTKLQKLPAVSTLLTVNMLPGAFTCTVADPSIVQVGYAVTIWDTTNEGNNGNVTIGVVTNIAGSVITIDTAAWASYLTTRSAKMTTTFPLIANAVGATDSEIDHLILDGQANAEDVLGSFEGSTISLIGAKRFDVHHCRLLNAASDAYSDQGNTRAWDGTAKTVCDNKFHHNTVLTAKQHGVHLGTGLDGGKITDNLIDGAASEGVHYSNTIENTRVAGNTIRNCVRGVASLDAVSPYNTITENEIIGVQTGIEVGAASFCDITDNTLRGCTSRAISVQAGKHNQIKGNTIVLPTGGANGIELQTGSHFNHVVDNAIKGGASAPQAQVYLFGSDNCAVEGNEFADGYRGLMVYDSDGGTAKGNGFENFVQNTIEFEAGATSTDWSMEDNRGVGTYFGLANAPRHVINNMGDNGATSNPALAGDWFGITGQRHNGRRVRWGNRVSMFWSGVGWIEIPAPPAVPTFDPRVFSGLTAWWEADLLTGLVDGSAIDSWYDYSGHARHLAATGTARPLYKTGIINGKPVVRADGVDDILVPAGSIPMSALYSPTDYTYICVLRSIVNNTNAGAAYDNDAAWADSSGWIGLHLKSAGTIHAYDDAASPSVAKTDGTALLVAVRHGSGTVGISKNGGAETTGAQGTSTLTGQFRMFGGQGSANLWNGDVAALLMWNRRLTDTELAEAVGAYRTKYGL